MKLQLLPTFLLAFCTVSVISCSEDDAEPGVINQPLPPAETFLQVKKVTQTTHYGSAGSDTSVTNYFYDENGQLNETQTLAGITTYGAVFHYEGNKVTSVEYTQNGLPDGLTTFYYTGNALSYTLSGEDQQERTNFNYNGDKVTHKTVFYPNGPGAQLLESTAYTYENGNVAQEQNTTYWAGQDVTRLVYTYDQQHNPFAGLNPYLQLTMSNEGFNGLSANNPITKKAYNPINETTPQEYHYEIEYNPEQYPILIKRYDTQSNFLISETTIEYY